MRDLYRVLGLKPDASTTEIKRAYRKLAHAHHPDKTPGDQKAEERFKEAATAYAILSDPEQRRRYDHEVRAPFGRHGGGARSSSGFGDVFSEIFGDFLGRKDPPAQKKGADRDYRLTIDFRIAVYGGTRVVQVTRGQTCDLCHGTGAKPGTVPLICHACGGGGQIRVQRGLFSVAKQCGYCQGRGRINREPCPTCKGNRRVDRQTALEVRIPASTENGAVIRYAGGGEPGQHGGSPGDLRIIIGVTPHPLFTRKGSDLHLELPVSIREAALGASIEVPTLDGTVRMRLPAGTQSGRIFRLRGKGGPKDKSGERGDEHVTVIVETPEELDQTAREALATINALDDDAHLPRRAAFRKATRDLGARD